MVTPLCIVWSYVNRNMDRDMMQTRAAFYDILYDALSRLTQQEKDCVLAYVARHGTKYESA